MTDEANQPGAQEGGKTEVGNYFVSNYPPFSFWDESEADKVRAVMAGPPSPGVPLGVYLHIPFCRKRCDFCYFKVYTDKNSKEIKRYLDAMLTELDHFAAQPYLQGRKPDFVYFGGGTPSYLAADQIQRVFEGIQERFPFDDVKEVAFECEPGTLSEPKIEKLYELGVTRISLGVENFDPEILELNNRAHRAKEIHRTYRYAREVGFDQINIDLIAGMVGETEENWKRCIEETIALEPDSVTIYQLEVPYNTTIYRRMQDDGKEVAPVADWETKRRWTSEAFARLEEVGYHLGSAYTAVRGDRIKFVYRDALWRGADMLGVGVSSFSHMGGVHYQNEHTFDAYVRRVEGGELPITRALSLSEEEQFIREFILQMKLGSVELDYFRDKFGVDPLERFAGPLAQHRDEGWLTFDQSRVQATRQGLLRVDTLLPPFFLEAHRNARYA